VDDEKQGQGGDALRHRGRIQAQGGGLEKSEPWARPTPPTEGEMLEMCDRLEMRLTPREREDRERPFADLRQYIRRAARSGGVSAPFAPRSFPKRGSKDIRVDLEVITGMACVPDDSSGG
jgi:uncharacterized protein with von Willebrand factor type A (vWA) domain